MVEDEDEVVDEVRVEDEVVLRDFIADVIWSTDGI